jgi:drug/metabolite transporter (DMT)-like permease
MLKGVIFLLVAVSLGGTSDGFSKMLTDRQDFGPIVLARYLLPLIALLVTRRPADVLRLFATKAPGLQLLRALAPLLLTVLLVLGVRHLPLADATVILFAGPFLVILLSSVTLNETVRIYSWVGVCLGFAAVLLVVRPGFGEVSVYSLLPAGAAVCYAFFQILSRRLTSAGESAETMFAWTILVGFLVSLPFAWSQWSPPSTVTWILFILVGGTYGSCHFFFAEAFAQAPASILTPFSYFQIVAAAIFGFLAFRDLPDVWSFAGIGLILLGGLLTFLGGEREGREQAAAASSHS